MIPSVPVRITDISCTTSSVTEDQQGLYLASFDGVGTPLADADSGAAVLSNDRIIFNTQGVIAVHQLDLTRGSWSANPKH